MSTAKNKIFHVGKVGIGTDTPNGDLQIRAGANASFRVLADASTSGLFVGNYGSGDGYRSLSLLGSNIRLHTITAGALSGAEQRVHITPTGQVGIGTDTVRNNRTVQITGESGTTLLLTGFAPSIHFNGQSSTDSSDNDRTMIGQASGSNHMVNGSSSGDTVLRATSSGKLLFGIGTAVKMQINSAGKLGIGAVPSTGVDIGYDIHIKKGSGEPNGKLIIQSHDTANSNAQLQLLARDNSNNNETCVIKAQNASVSSQVDLWLYTNNNANQSIKLTGNDGAAYFQGVNSSGLTYQFYNASTGGGSDTRVLIKTYANQGADPYIKFDSGGTNMIVGQLYAGTTNNKLVLGAGESPSGGVNGIHIESDGDVSVNTDGATLSGGGTFTVRSGSTAGLMKLHGGSSNHGGQITLFGGSNTGGGNGGDIQFRGGSGSGEQTVVAKILGDSKTLQVENTDSGKDSAFNVFKSTGDNNDDAVLRVGYNSANCYAISRKRNSSSIQVDANQSDAVVHHTAGGDDTMLLTNRNSVHIAKLAPMVIQRPHIQSSASWGGSRPYTFVMRFSTGGFSGTYHVARMITQRDWGFSDWEAKVYRDYYSPSGDDGATERFTGYYDSHTHIITNYNQGDSGTGTGNGQSLSRNTNLGPSGSFTIHQSANGGYYRDAYATDYYVSLGNYSGVVIEVTVKNPGGWLKDQATSVTTIYPAAFGNSASQSDADSWSYGRGIWFNVRPGVLDTSWWGYSSNFGQQTLPTS